MINTLILITLLILINITQSTDSSLRLVQIYFKLVLNSVHLSLPIGKPANNMLEVLDQDSQYTWTTSRFFNIDISLSSKYICEAVILFNNESLKAAEYQDTVTLHEANVSFPIVFNLVSSIDYDLPIEAGSFAFAHILKEKKFSLVDQLSTANFINHSAYSIVFDELREGHISIGGIPNEDIENMQSGSCRVRKDNVRWGCELKEVYFSLNNENESNAESNDKDNTPINKPNYINSNESYFQVKEMNIDAPMDFMDYFAENIIKVYAEQDCQDLRSDSFRLFHCNKKAISNLPNINFAFANMTLTLPLKKLFVNQGEYKALSIQWSRSYDNQWVFGISFLLQYHSLFDYDNHSITLYAKKGISRSMEDNGNNNESKMRNNRLVKQLYVNILFLQLIGITVLATIMVKEKSNSIVNIAM